MPKSDQPTKTSRNFIFTAYRDEYTFKPHDEVKYLIYQFEKCPTTDRTHIQGYVELNKSVRYTQVITKKS